MKVHAKSQKWYWGYRYRIVERHITDDLTYFKVQKKWFIFFWTDLNSETYHSLEEAINHLETHKDVIKKRPNIYHYIEEDK